MRNFFILALLLLATGAVYGKTLYVNRAPLVIMYTTADASENSEIAALLPYKTAVKLIKEQDGFSQVQTAKGKMGWIPTKYLKEQDNHENEGLMERSEEKIKQSLKDFEEKWQSFKQEKLKPASKKTQTQAQQAIQKFKSLDIFGQQKIADLQQQNQQMTQQIHNLKKRSLYLAASALLVGILLGLWLRRKSKPKQRNIFKD